MSVLIASASFSYSPQLQRVAELEAEGPAGSLLSEVRTLRAEKAKLVALLRAEQQARMAVETQLQESQRQLQELREHWTKMGYEEEGKLAEQFEYQEVMVPTKTPGSVNELRIGGYTATLHLGRAHLRGAHGGGRVLAPWKTRGARNRGIYRVRISGSIISLSWPAGTTQSTAHHLT